MKAIVLHRYGPPDVLQYQDVPDPEPRAGEIRIRVGAATVNRVLDVAFRGGEQVQDGISLPVIPGVDCAGVIDCLGDGVTRWRVGDRVADDGRTAAVRQRLPQPPRQVAHGNSFQVDRLPRRVREQESSVSQPQTGRHRRILG